MQKFEIRDAAHAKTIINVYEHCRNCSGCPLNSPEGWRCGYLYERAREYLDRHKDQ